MFLGLTEKGLSVTVAQDAGVHARDGWTLDEEMTDLTDFYLRALDELAATGHGREVVLPALLDRAGDDVDLHAHGEFAEALEHSGMDDSQVDAVAMCLAAERFHLIQGPPGTGKTHALACLVRELVGQGQRVLLTTFTHRAIHHALRKVGTIVDCPVFKVSDPLPHDAAGIEFRDRFADTLLLDHDGPYVIGATPLALFSGRASEARFDVAVIDETSQTPACSIWVSPAPGSGWWCCAAGRRNRTDGLVLWVLWFRRSLAGLEAGAGHAFAQAALLQEILFQAAELLV